VIVLDASAVLAFLQGEPGADSVEEAMSDAVIGAANWSEIAQKVRARGADWDIARALVLDAGTIVVPVTVEDAEGAASLWRPRTGLPLADRLCLALTRRMDTHVLTADQAWNALPVPEAQLVRMIR
jgi:ribonuclease VapC